MSADKEAKSIFPGDDPWGELDEYESRIKMQLAEMYDQYRMRAKPLIDTLVRIESLRPPKTMYAFIEDIDPAYAQRLRDMAAHL